MSYLLDTNTVSEVMKPAPEAAVVSWLARFEGDCFLSSVTVGEIERGIALLPTGRKKSHLQETFLDFLATNDDRILSLDLVVARRWAILTSTARRKGRPLSIIDSMIEATALNWDLTLVTRNVSDFFEARTLNPWTLTQP